MEEGVATSGTANARSHRVLLISMIVFGGAILAVYITPKRAGVEDPAVNWPVSEFTLTAQDGRTIEKRYLLGKVWIADFIFTSCAGTCPIMTTAMVELQKRLADVPDVRFVSVSVDPVRDKPEVMAGYAKFYNADPNRWLFLTGEEAEIRKLVTDSFKLMSGESLLFHSERFSIVDRQGRVRTGYDGTKSESLDKVVADVRAIARERS